MKLTCSNCGLYKEPNRLYTQAYCQDCQNQYNSLHRPKYSELTDYEKKKANARTLANAALKAGKLERQPCEQCGFEITEFHHEDYNKPLEVRHLCRPCHLEIHRMKDSEEYGEAKVA